jgi:hypothetical protein
MKRWQEIALWIVGTLGIMYGMIYVDVVMRAHEAYEQGEKYWRWAEHPEARKAALDDKLAADKRRLDEDFAKGKVSKEEYARNTELLQFDHDQALQESSLKYAYLWYQTAAELFSPPQSKWVRLAREKMPLAKELWKAELRAKHIPFEDYMID